MKTIYERLWPAFLAEASEQLDTLSRELSRLDAESDTGALDVRNLFRNFHTVKGGCVMMGYANLGALAEAAEDALDPIRRGEFELDPALAGLLLTAVNALRQQLKETEITRMDAAPRDDLITRLRVARIAAVQRGYFRIRHDSA